MRHALIRDMKSHVGLAFGLASAFTVLLGCGTDSPERLDRERASSCQIEDSVETLEQCSCMGAVVRPSTGGGVSCLDGEVELGWLPFGIEGALCCAKD